MRTVNPPEVAGPSKLCGRLSEPAPVTVSRRGRSEEPHGSDNHRLPVGEQIAQAQLAARARTYSRSYSRERGAYIGPHTDGHAVLEVLDAL